MERVALFCDNEVVEPDDLGLSVMPPTTGRVTPAPSGEVEIEFPKSGLSLEAVEKALIMRAMQEASGNQSGAARLLGISRDTLRYRLDKYALGE
jgi:DNA-binding NtrC family response regulator